MRTISVSVEGATVRLVPLATDDPAAYSEHLTWAVWFDGSCIGHVTHNPGVGWYGRFAPMVYTDDYPVRRDALAALVASHL